MVDMSVHVIAISIFHFLIYLNGGQENTAQSMDASITEVTVSKNVFTWDEAFS